MSRTNWLHALGRIPAKWVWTIAAVLAAGVVAVSASLWAPSLQSLLAAPDDAGQDDAGGHKHAKQDAIELSDQARRNIGLRVASISLQDYDHTVTIPAVVVDRPGRTHFKIAAPMTGVVTGVAAVRGETVESGALLFKLRLTHEDLIQAQTQVLKTLSELDAENKKIALMQESAGRAVPEILLKEREYERDKLQAIGRAQREALRLHGLSDEQVQKIVADRRLIREAQVFVPFLHADNTVHSYADTPLDDPQDRNPTLVDGPHPLVKKQFVVSQLSVQIGEVVPAGKALCELADYTELYIEGRAFEHDADDLHRVVNSGRLVTAVREGSPGASPDAVSGVRTLTELAVSATGGALAGYANEHVPLQIVYVSNEVDRESRALHFYVRLPNGVVHRQSGERRYVTWKYKPGQRMQLRVPVQVWQKVIVLPVDAIAEEGAESYVFVENGTRFNRRPVHVEHRDQLNVVIANDGSLFPNDRVALSGAHQLLVALKNKAGGAVDPHAGHNH